MDCKEVAKDAIALKGKEFRYLREDVENFRMAGAPNEEQRPESGFAVFYILLNTAATKGGESRRAATQRERKCKVLQLRPAGPVVLPNSLPRPGQPGAQPLAYIHMKGLHLEVRARPRQKCHPARPGEELPCEG